MKTQYEIEDSADDRGVFYEGLIASMVVFGRTIDGLDIVGAGSKVAITFANDGTSVAVDCDWPQYSKLDAWQKVLDIRDIEERARVQSRIRVGDSSVERFECGYFDAGGKKRRRDLTAPIQTACFVHELETKTANFMPIGSGRITVLPIGEKVEYDDAWPMARTLSSLKK